MQLIETARAAFRGVGNLVHNLQAAPEVAVTEPADLFAGARAVPTKEWTVLAYLDGRDRLARSTDLALNKMEQVGSTKDVNVVVQATLEPNWHELCKPNMQAVPTRRYFIERDQDPDKVTSPVVGDLKKSVPLTEQSLTDFMTWGMKNFPAKHYLLLVKKHGPGFAKVGEQAPLSARELKNALEKTRQATGQGVDVVSFDSCSMQQMEVAYQIKDQAKVMTGSPEDIPAVTYPYGTLLDGLTHHPQATPQEVGKLVVEAHRQTTSRGIQSASDLTGLKAFGEAMRALTTGLVQQKVPRELIYTAMLTSKSMEPGESDALQFNFRDLGGFLSTLATDERFPAGLRESAGQARQALSHSLIDHFATQGREHLKKPTGYSTFMPWKAFSPELKAAYGQLDYVQDTGWLKLLDYVFEGPTVSDSNPPTGKHPFSLTQFPLKQYKKYVSGYLPVACQYTPSCSQYAREALEKYGLIKGGWKSALRVLSCNGHQSEGFDPVDPCQHEEPSAPTVRSSFLVAPPAPVQKSAVRQRLERIASNCAGVAAATAGAACSALVALPVGAAMGAFFGWKAGTNQMDQFTAHLLESQREATVWGMLKIARPVGQTADHLNQLVARKTGSQTLANVVGGTLGPLSGALRGAVGAALVLGHEGYKYGHLWGRNIVKDHFGELPTHPENEEILRRDYA